MHETFLVTYDVNNNQRMQILFLNINKINQGGFYKIALLK